MIDYNESETEYEKQITYRFNKNKPRPRPGHKYTKYKICYSMIMLICIKQHLSNI